MPRLPIPGSDNNAWGDILNAFLQVEHNSDGTLKDTGTIAGKADISYVDATVDAATADDSSTQKVEVSKAGTLTGARKQVNFIEGSNVTITTADNSGSNRVDVTIGATQTATDLVVNVLDHGATGDGITDDTAAINAAVTASQVGGQIGTVYFPPGVYKLTSAITIYQGMTWSGPIGAGEREFGARAVIKNTTTDIFQLSADTRDVSISNLNFQGNSSNYFLTPVVQSSGFILKYSTIKDCGFKLFSSVFRARWLGVWFNANYLNDCSSTVLDVAGSDNVIRDNFLDSNLAGTPTAAFIVNFNSMSDTLFEGNYVTCCPSMGMRINAGGNNVIAFNKFNGLSPRGSGSDGAGLYILETNAMEVVGNYFAHNVQSPFGQYTGAITLYDSSGVTFTDNIFDQQPALRNMYLIGQSSTTTDSIKIKGSIYRSSTSKLSTAGTVTNLTWDEWQGKYKTGSSARIADSDYPGTPPNGTTGLVYDTSNSSTYIAQRSNGAWSHYAVAGSTSAGLVAVGINSQTNVTGTTETLLQSYTIAGNTAVAGDTYRVGIGGVIDIGTAGGSLTIFNRIGGIAGTQIGGVAWTLLTSPTTNRPFWATFDIVIRGNASSSVTLVSTGHGFGSSSAVSGSGVLNFTSGTRDLTTNQDLVISARFNTSDASHALHVETLTITKVR